MSSKSDLSACFSKINFTPNLDNFDERKRFQKLVYLLKSLDVGINLNYNWYLHGPYSPDLTSMFLDGKELKGNVIDKNKLDIEKSNLKLMNLKKFLTENKLKLDELELIASILFIAYEILKKQRILKSHKTPILEFLSKNKPYFKTNQLEDAWKYSIKFEEVVNM